MTQDFAKIRPEPLLERKMVETPPAWSLMITGMIVGLVVGVFACFLFYLSGNVPPLSSSLPEQGGSLATLADPVTIQAAAEPAEAELELEFYSALPDYEVSVDATPVELTAQQAGIDVEDEPLATGFVLQTGAFQQLSLANSEMRRQQLLGLEVSVKQQELIGRTLYLVQSGPYTSSKLLYEAERLLRLNNIPSLRMSPL
jgi:hypothetical protein